MVFYSPLKDTQRSGVKIRLKYKFILERHQTGSDPPCDLCDILDEMNVVKTFLCL